METATGKANLVFGFTLAGSMISRAWEVTVPCNQTQEEHARIREGGNKGYERSGDQQLVQRL